MQKLLLVITIIVFSFICCDSDKDVLSKTEHKTLELALVSNDTEIIDKGIELLEKRIKKYNLKTDLSLKVQLLIKKRSYFEALDLSKIIISKFPDYVEMITLHCVLSKYLLSPETSYATYVEAIESLSRIGTNRNFIDDYNTLLSKLLLSVLFKDKIKKELYSKEIFNLSLSEDELTIIQHINNSADSELFMMFGILE